MCHKMNSVSTIRNDYYCNKHGIQDPGQLNSIASIHDPCYMAPQRMYEMGPNTCSNPIKSASHFHLSGSIKNGEKDFLSLLWRLLGVGVLWCWIFRPGCGT